MDHTKKSRVPMCIVAGGLVALTLALWAPSRRYFISKQGKMDLFRTEEAPAEAGVWRVPVIRRRLHHFRDPKLRLDAHYRFWDNHTDGEDTAAAEDAAPRKSEFPIAKESGIQYVGMVGLGTPAQQFLVAFDTGSANLWVPGTSCKQCNAAGKLHRRFDPDSSQSYAGDAYGATIEYGAGSCTGTLAVDSLTLGDMTVPGVPFLEAAMSSQLFQQGDIDGVLGLALGGAAALEGMPAPVEALAHAHGSGMPAPVFSFQMPGDGANGHLVFGAVDKSRYPHGVQWVEVVQPADHQPYGHWAVPLDGVDIGGIAGSGGVAVLDISTGPLVLPKADAKVFFTLAQEARAAGGGSCGTMPPISLTMAGRVYTLTGEDYGVWEESVCTLRILASDEPHWVLGDVFQRKYPAVYDFGSNPPRVALPKESAAAPTKRRILLVSLAALLVLFMLARAARLRARSYSNIDHLDSAYNRRPWQYALSRGLAPNAFMLAQAVACSVSRKGKESGPHKVEEFVIGDPDSACGSDDEMHEMAFSCANPNSP